jgi:hypothetical protein
MYAQPALCLWVGLEGGYASKLAASIGSVNCPLGTQLGFLYILRKKIICGYHFCRDTLVLKTSYLFAKN